MAKRILMISDQHTGSDIGLTHPAYQRRTKDQELSEWAWNYIMEGVEKHGPYDLMLCGADAIEGKQYKDKGCGIWTADPLEQCEAAARGINAIRMHCKRGAKACSVTGTCYHVDVAGTSAEHYLAGPCDFDKVEDRIGVEVEGMWIDLRHKGPKGSTPNTGIGLSMKRNLWNVTRDLVPKDMTQLTIHGHSHEVRFGWQPELGYAIALPAMQLAGGKYGRQHCDGFVHFGFVVIEVSNGEITNSAFHYEKIRNKAIPSFVV